MKSQLKRLGKIFGVTVLLTVGSLIYLGAREIEIDPPLIVGAFVFFLGVCVMADQ